MAYSVLMYC